MGRRWQLDEASQEEEVAGGAGTAALGSPGWRVGCNRSDPDLSGNYTLQPSNSGNGACL